MAIYHLVNKELEYLMHIAYCNTSYLEFPKAKCLSLILTYAIFFLTMEIVILLTHLDGSTPYVSCKNAEEVLNSMEYMSSSLSKWFTDNYFYFKHVNKGTLFIIIDDFSYCRLSWMLHSRNLNLKINSLFKRCLLMACSGKTSSFNKFLK